jgi:protoheme IX farnesyltransferase
MSVESKVIAGERAETSVREFFELTKPRLSLLSVITAMVGYAASVEPGKGWATPVALFVGTALSAGACGALNQYMEREHDAVMPRTRNRPIPSGAVAPGAALAFGLALGIAGLGVMWVGTNLQATLYTAATIASYLLAYTPLKRLTSWCTIVGSLPGALPPLIGCAAAHAAGELDALGWSQFGLLFAWQIPHFMALAWTYKKDYAEGKFVVSTVIDPSGKNAAWQSLLFTFAMVVCSLVPAYLGLTTAWFYPVVAGACGAYFLKRAVDFMNPEKRDVVARKLFLASIAYLPAVLIALLVDLKLLK